MLYNILSYGNSKCYTIPNNINYLIIVYTTIPIISTTSAPPATHHPAIAHFSADCARCKAAKRSLSMSVSNLS